MKIFGFAGYSGSGKTTLIEKLIPLFVQRGLKVSLIKHAHHTFDVDQPGKDSFRHRHAGCTEVLVTSSRRWALMSELRGAPEPTLNEQLSRLSPCDLLLVEGFKQSDLLKVEVWRADAGQPTRYTDDDFVVAIATDDASRLPAPTQCPLLDINDHDAVAQWLIDQGDRFTYLAERHA
jgi:molybdopterin-guanine dinucleotide biosynthesis protein B